MFKDDISVSDTMSRLIDCSYTWHGVLRSESVHFLLDCLNFSISFDSGVELGQLASGTGLNALGDFNTFDKERDNFGHLCLLHSSGCHSGGAETHTTWGYGAVT